MGIIQLGGIRSSWIYIGFIGSGCFSSYTSNFHLASPSNLSHLLSLPCARSQWLSNGLSTWQVGSGWFRWVGNPLSLELLKWNQKQGQVDPICSSLPTPNAHRFHSFPIFFYHFLSNQFIQVTFKRSIKLKF